MGLTGTEEEDCEMIDFVRLFEGEDEVGFIATSLSSALATYLNM